MRGANRFWTAAVLSVLPVACDQRQAVQHPASGSSSAARVRDAGPPINEEVRQDNGRGSKGSIEDKGAEATSTTGQSAPEASSDGGAPASSGAQAPGTSPGNGLADICEKITQRATQSCSSRVAGFYQSSCDHYVKTPGPCEAQIRLALECQYATRDEAFCAHESVYECAQVNRDLKVCQGGAAPESQLAPEDDHTLPPSWEPVKDTELGFSVAMPGGAALDTQSKRRTWKAEENGISYYVAALEPPSGKLNDQAFVRAVVAHVGARCQLHLRLRGELQLKGTTVVQYHSACPDKTEWHGMLHFWDGKAVSTGYHAPPGAAGVNEPYFYSFEPAK